MDYKELLFLMSQQEESMSSDERMKAYREGKEVDILPYNLFAPDLAFANIYGFTTKQFTYDTDVKCEIIRRKKEEFGLHTFSVTLGLKGIGSALGSELEVPENGIDYIKKHALIDYKNMAHMKKVDPYNNKFLTPIIISTKEVRRRFPDIGLSTTVAGPFSTAISLRPIEMVIRDIKKRPSQLHELLNLCVENSLAWVQAFYNEFGAVPVTFSDPVTSMDILSKKVFDEFSAPHLIDLINGVEKITGTKPGGHICGHTRKIWKDLADMGLRNLSLDNLEDLEVAKQEIGHRMSISGNVPPVDIMLLGTIDDVIASCRECIIKCADNPKGFTLSQGCQPPIGVPRENFYAFIYAAKKYGRGAKIGELPKGILEDEDWKG